MGLGGGTSLLALEHDIANINTGTIRKILLRDNIKNGLK
jgi:hypothetical protein